MRMYPIEQMAQSHQEDNFGNTRAAPNLTEVRIRHVGSSEEIASLQIKERYQRSSPEATPEFKGWRLYAISTSRVACKLCDHDACAREDEEWRNLRHFSSSRTRGVDHEPVTIVAAWYTSSEAR
jgi:hypothetical protein